jgi:hypothetical protein
VIESPSLTRKIKRCKKVKKRGIVGSTNKKPIEEAGRRSKYIIYR